MADSFEKFAPSLTSPYIGGFAVTPHDTNPLAFVTRGIMVGVTGAVAMVMSNGDSVTLTGLLVGVIYPVRASKILSTGTTATGIVALV